MMKKKSNFKNENNQFKNKIVEATLRGDINEIKDMIDNGEDINSFDQVTFFSFFFSLLYFLYLLNSF